MKSGGLRNLVGLSLASVGLLREVRVARRAMSDAPAAPPASPADVTAPPPAPPAVPAAAPSASAPSASAPPATPAPLLVPPGVVRVASPPVPTPTRPEAVPAPAPPAPPAPPSTPPPDPSPPITPRASRGAAPARPAPVPMAWGWVAGLVLVMSIGVLGTVVAGALNRTGRPHADTVFWAALLVMVLPVAARLSARAPSRGERALLLAALGLALYLSKALHDPFAFTYPDEFFHLRNLEDILAQGGLFPKNSLLSVTVFYPGLQAVTAGLVQLSGLSPYAAGLIVVGAARLLMMLALFLLFERLSGSARLAGLAGLVYIANPNFLFWSAQYSYESLALPLATLAVVGVAMRVRERRRPERLGWAIVAMVCITAVAITHHLTVYATLGLLVVVSLAAVLVLRRPRQAEWGLAAFTLLVAAAWLIQVAPATDQYLTEIFRRSFEGVSETLAGDDSGRALFESPRGDVTPLWQRGIAIGSIGLIAVILPFGLWRAWKRRRRAALLLVLAAGAAAYLAILPLRLVPSAWETASRASDFLYIGIGLVVALAGLHHLLRRHPVLRTAAVCAFVGVTVLGGVLAGWPASVRLSQPYRVEIGGRTVEPQGVALSQWARGAVGPDRRFVADETNARLLLAYGGQLPIGAGNGLAKTVLTPVKLSPEIASLMRAEGVDYVVIDRRGVANDNLAGYFFAPRGRPRAGKDGLVAPELLRKFDRTGGDRLFDSGDIVVYDTRRLEP